MKTIVSNIHSNHQAFSPPPCTTSGIPIIKSLEWGTHFCKFYNTFHDLMEVLVPYFLHGLNNNELCIWVNYEDINSVKISLQSIPALKAKIEQGQMQFFEKDIALNASAETTDSLLDNLLELEKCALQQGYSGLRLAGGPTNFSTKQAQQDFFSLENQVCSKFYGHRIIALCCYRLDECESSTIFDVVKSHQFAIILRNGQWEMIENASIKLLKEELHQQNMSLEIKVKDRTKKLEEALRNRDHFLSIASHELKTPLTTLKLYVDGLLYDTDIIREHPEHSINLLKKIQTQSVCLEMLISRLLDITAILNDQSLILEPQYIDLTDLVHRAITRFSENIPGKECHIDQQLQASVFANVDPLRINQILTNLLNNALKYAPGSQVSISLAKENDKVILELQDNGNGIDEEQQAKIFDRYTRLPSTQAQSGLGLGLWIVKEIVKAHKGEISLRSVKGKGCCFRIEFPQ